MRPLSSRSHGLLLRHCACACNLEFSKYSSMVQLPASLDGPCDDCTLCMHAYSSCPVFPPWLASSHLTAANECAISSERFTMWTVYAELQC